MNLLVGPLDASLIVTSRSCGCRFGNSVQNKVWLLAETKRGISQQQMRIEISCRIGIL